MARHIVLYSLPPALCKFDNVLVMTSLSGLQLNEGRKYSSDQLSEARLVMGDDLPEHIVNLIAASYAKSSWSKLISVMNAVKKFEADSKSVCKFPMSQELRKAGKPTCCVTSR